MDSNNMDSNKASTPSKKTTGTEAPTKIHELLEGIKTATEANGRELKAIRLLLEKTIQQGQGQQAAQATARSRPAPDHRQRRFEEAYAADENNEGDYDGAGAAAQAHAPTPYDAYRGARKTQPPGIIPLVSPRPI